MLFAWGDARDSNEKEKNKKRKNPPHGPKIAIAAVVAKKEGFHRAASFNQVCGVRWVWWKGWRVQGW